MHNQQLCWSCQRACGGKGCPWADKLKPVKGWSAKRRTYKDGYKAVVTYRISACPLYIRGKELIINFREVECIMPEGAAEYITADKGTTKKK